MEMAVFWDIVWLIPGNAIGFQMIVVYGKRIAKELKKGTSLQICIEEAIRSTRANVPLVFALLFTVIATAFCYVAILGHHTIEWLQILCINVTVWSVTTVMCTVFCMIFTNVFSVTGAGQLLEECPVILSTVSLMASLVIWSQLHYGPAICVVATVTNFTGIQSIAWYFFDLIRFENLVKSDYRRSVPLTGLSNMCPTEVADFLRSKGFDEYADTFEKHEVKGSHLAKLNTTDLEKMGVYIVGHQMDLITLFGMHTGKRSHTTFV